MSWQTHCGIALSRFAFSKISKDVFLFFGRSMAPFLVAIVLVAKKCVERFFRLLTIQKV